VESKTEQAIISFNKTSHFQGKKLFTVTNLDGNARQQSKE
jgi:hypothetical protein